MPGDQQLSATNNKSKNTYIMDPQRVEEMARLLLQDRIVTDAMGGLFPERLDHTCS